MREEKYKVLFDIWSKLKTAIEGKPTVSSEMVDFMVDLNGSVELFVSHTDENGLSELSVAEEIFPQSPTPTRPNDLDVSSINVSAV